MFEFNPDDITKESMRNIADHIEGYVDELLENMIIPDEISKADKERFDEGIRRSRKLINKLRKGNTSIFKDIDD